MRIASILGFLLALVAMALALAQVSDLEDVIVAEASGAVATFADHLTFLWLLLLMVMLVGLLAGVIAWLRG